MISISVRIEGNTPLLMNRFTEDAEIAVSSGTSAAVKSRSKLSPREQAEKKRYVDDKGNLYLPGPNIFACLIQAGTFHKIGKSKVTTLKSSLIPAGLSVTEIVCPLGTKEFEVDSRSVVIPATGGRIMCHRPRLDSWGCDFTLEVDDDMFHPDFVREIVEDAGRKVGLGDFRPARKGPFGKFAITGWKVQKAGKKAA